MNKIKSIFIKAVSGILLFVIYIFIVNIALFLFGDGSYDIYSNEIINVLCVCIAGIITPIWYFLSMKNLKLEYKKISDYIPSAVSFCAICFGMFAIDSTIYRINKNIYTLGLYVVVNCLYFYVSYLIHEGKEYRHMLLKRIVATAILYAIYTLIIIGGFVIGIGFLAVGVAIIITPSFYSITTKYYKISYDVWGIITTIVIFEIINLIFWSLAASDIEWCFAFVIISSFVYAFIGLASFVIIWICRYIKREMQDDEGYQQSAEDLSSDEEEEKDITDENKPTNGSEPYVNNNLQKAVLENMKSFLLDSENDFLLIDEEYHLQAGKDVYYPNLLLYHMKLQCFTAVNLITDNFKAEYLDRMNAYLETLDRDFKKPTDNPSMGIFLCKNEEIEVVEYSLNKGLSQEMKDEYETKLIDKEILKEKLGELYDRAKETNRK